MLHSADRNLKAAINVSQGFRKETAVRSVRGRECHRGNGKRHSEPTSGAATCAARNGRTPELGGGHTEKHGNAAREATAAGGAASRTRATGVAGAERREDMEQGKFGRKVKNLHGSKICRK